MRVALLLAMLTAATPVLSATEQAPRPPQAPAIPAVPPQAPTVTPERCRCEVTDECTCGTSCHCATRPTLTYADARPRAVRERRVLVVWVGTSCPACVRQLRDCLHVHVRTFPGVTGAGVVVGVPRDGELWRTDLAGQPTTEQIRSVIRGATATRPATFQGMGPVGVAAPVHQPTFAVGGFGGAACAPGRG